MALLIVFYNNDFAGACSCLVQPLAKLNNLAFDDDCAILLIALLHQAQVDTSVILQTLMQRKCENLQFLKVLLRIATEDVAVQIVNIRAALGPISAEDEPQIIKIIQTFSNTL